MFYIWFSSDLFFSVTAYPAPGKDQFGSFILHEPLVYISEALKLSLYILLKDENVEPKIEYCLFRSFFKITEAEKSLHGYDSLNV